MARPSTYETDASLDPDGDHHQRRRQTDRRRPDALWVRRHLRVLVASTGRPGAGRRPGDVYDHCALRHAGTVRQIGSHPHVHRHETVMSAFAPRKHGRAARPTMLLCVLCGALQIARRVIRVVSSTEILDPCANADRKLPVRNAVSPPIPTASFQPGRTRSSECSGTRYLHDQGRSSEHAGAAWHHQTPARSERQ